MIASDNLEFTIDATRKYTILPICASNTYTNSTLEIAKNGIVVRTITTNTIDIIPFELELEKGDNISISITGSDNNAATFCGAIFY